MATSITQSLAVASTESAPQGFTSEQIDIITNSVAKGASPEELAYFLEVCRSTGLNPLHRQIYAIMRKTDGKPMMTIQTGIDGYRLLAHRSGRHAGTDDAVYDTEEAEHPNKATVTVYKVIRGVRYPFTATARWVEYCQVYNNKPTSMWQKFPYLMLAKCAEALALRKAFPAETAGIRTDDEMMQADEPMVQVHAQQQIAAAAVTITEERPKLHSWLEEHPKNEPKPTGSMTVNDFCRKVKDNLGMTPKEAMVALSVKSLTGINLDLAYRTLQEQVHLGEESQEPLADEIAAGLKLEALHIKANRLGYSMAQWEQLKSDCSDNPETIAAALEDVESKDLRGATKSAAGVH